MDVVSEPELIEGGRPDGRSPVVPPSVWRLAAAAGIVALAVVAISSRGSSTTAPRASPSASKAVDSSAGQNVGEVSLSTMARRSELIRDVPDAYRDAASLASAMRDGRTPGNFFLAMAYERSWYGKWLAGSEGQWYGPRGPVQWESAEFRRYADPDHGDITAALDSFLAVDSALHARGTPDFAAGAYGPARLLGMRTSEALDIASIYDALTDSGVREEVLR
jgi:hypothetical protein